MKIRQAAARILIALSAILSGCIFTGPAVKVGDVNANAKVNSSITIGPNGGDCCNAVPFETPTATATAIATSSVATPVGKLIIVEDFTAMKAFDGGTCGGLKPLHSMLVTAKDANVVITKLPYSRIGDAPNEDDIYKDSRLKGPDGIFVTIPGGLKNGAVIFENPNGIITIIKNTTVNIQLLPNLAVGFGLSSDLASKKTDEFEGKTIGFTIKDISKVETLNPAVEKIGVSPLGNQVLAHSCFGTLYHTLP